MKGGYHRTRGSFRFYIMPVLLKPTRVFAMEQENISRGEFVSFTGMIITGRTINPIIRTMTMRTICHMRGPVGIRKQVMSQRMI